MRALSILIIIISVLRLSVQSVEGFWNTSSLDSGRQLLIGEFVFETLLWQEELTYSEGDIVLWNGSLWQRNGRGLDSNIEPSLSPPGRNFWIPID